MAAAAERALRRLLDLTRDYPGMTLRRAMAGGRAAWIGRLPAAVRRRLDLDGVGVTPLRVEIGGGRFPSPGYIHVDADRTSRHLEYVAPAWQLPFPDASVYELLAIHVLEHVHPTSIERTLREWRRILAPGGFAEIHVPDAATVFPAFLASTIEKKWDLLIPIFGMTGDPTTRRKGVGVDLERHHVIYDFDLLRQVLLRAGFDHVDDVSETVSDRHTEAWKESELVDRVSLVVRAFAG
jgi:predicted SAM-dependent methyltransferase